MPSLAERFMRILEGASRSHGTHGEAKSKNGSPKLGIRDSARTIKEPVTEELWQLHLGGERPLGIVPIREDDQCMWGAVDVDDYGVDAPGLVKILEKLGIPAIVCRTKSNGAHVYVFFNEPVPAKDVLPRLRELAAVLGYGGSEIFPKQETVLADRGDLGSWLNMPYFGGDKTTRFAIDQRGNGLTMEQFLALAEDRRMSRAQFGRLKFRVELPEFGDGPPCLEILAARKLVPGEQNNGLINFGVFAKKKWPEEWEKKLEEWNATKLDPPGSSDGLQSVIKSLRKKDYQYKCKDQPIVSVCNSGLCRTRPHGVSGGNGGTPLESLSILGTEPELCFVVLKNEGRTVAVSVETLLNSHDFQIQTAKQLHIVLPEYARPTWNGFVGEVMDRATIIEQPHEASTRGKFEEAVETFFLDRFRGEERADVMRGKPWHDIDNHRVVFRLRDLEKFLDREKFAIADRGATVRSWVCARIREMGGGDMQFNIDRKNKVAWWLPDELYDWDRPQEILPPETEHPM